MMRARDERDLYFKSHPKDTDRDYLLAVFDDLAKLPGTKDVFGPHNPVSAYRNWLSGDAAQKLIEFFQKIDTDGTGEIIHDFTDAITPTGGWDTRFLGDMYQDLSEDARKKYALLQTPVFVEEFILERTLEPAINEFGLAGFKMIDPACGSGHFLLGGFARILGHWRKQEPGTPDRELVNRALAAVHGVDLNPYVVAIARFRLLVAAMRECRITKLKDAPAFAFNLVCGDSLLHGSPGGEQQVLGFHELAHAYQSEGLEELRRILKPGQYHAVVANPPYITPKDKALNQAYRERYPEVCHMKYPLAVPFLQRLFDLAVSPGSLVRDSHLAPAPAGILSGASREGIPEKEGARKDSRTSTAGFVGQITANSFMKREFGKKLIESYLPKIDLTHVIDTSGAYIPGHGTPTVILFGRQRRPVAPAIRAVMGIKGEPATPDNPAQGLVWSAILDQIDRVGSQSAFVSVNDTPRVQFAKHPWSIGGGGAAELKEQLDESDQSLSNLVESIGFVCITKADEFFQQPEDALRRKRCESAYQRSFGIGEEVRDWGVIPGDWVIFPYLPEIKTVPLKDIPGIGHEAWRVRTELGNRKVFGGQNYFEAEKPWYEYGQIPVDRLRTPLSIVFAFVATHNHFVLDRGGKVFKQSAPVIKLPEGATEDDHLALWGLLNSSTACFWGRQTLFPKGGFADGKWEERLEWDGTKLQTFPLPAERPLSLAKQIDALSRQRAGCLPEAVLAGWQGGTAPGGLAASLAAGSEAARSLLAQMIALQEELDWECYRLYGLLPPEDGHAESAPTGPSGALSSAPAGPWNVATGEVGEAGATRGQVGASSSPRRGEGTLSERDRNFLRPSGAVSPIPFPTGSASRRDAPPVATTLRPSGAMKPSCPRDFVVNNPPPINLGQRAFEIVMARKMAAGELQTTWFERHGSTPTTQIPADWPEDYRKVVERRIELIETDPNIRLIEQPEYKRRWNTEPWEDQQERALRTWLLDRLESYFDLDGRMTTLVRDSHLAPAPAGILSGESRGIPAQEGARKDSRTSTATAHGELREPRLTSVAKVADFARQDKDFMQVAELYAGRMDFDVANLVGELVAAESVPALPILRYKPSGLDKRTAWERTWDLQRLEDAVDALFEEITTKARREPAGARFPSRTRSGRNPFRRPAGRDSR